MGSKRARSRPVVGYSEDKEGVLRRLRRIEGQVRGLQRMVGEDAYCIDVLTQVSAVTHALDSVALELLGDHLGHCVRDAVAQGGPDADAKLREAREAIERLVRS
jgi:CsoR family transcriptional regulator, copper-sensing transcriptional repressor